MKTNFWKLINDVDIKEIQIPRLQRNYVQGKRIDLGGNNKEKAVHLMGDRLIEHVLDKLIKMESIDLDFIYGSERDQIIYPLDGQQRLTLLWLIHWYIGIRKGLSEDEKNALAKFSYATRSSSRLFIKNLIYNFDFSNTLDLTIREQINQYNWFHIEWLFDPTVDSMLNVIEYHIEPKLKDLNHIELWNYLTEKQEEHSVSIIFTWKNIKYYAKSDDLYIKMNGRGLLLESLDNFRADIAEKFGYDDESSKWVCGLISKFQGKWSELFWKKLTDDKKNLMYNPNNTKEHISIESNLYELMCRFFLYKSIRDFSSSSSPDCERVYDFRYHHHLRYTKLDVFFPENGNEENLREMLKDFESVMEKIEEIEIIQHKNFHLNTLVSPYWKIEEEPQFNIIPNPDKGVEYITQKNMVIFSAVMIFLFEASVLPSEKCLLWQMWMKLIWNIIENSNINSYETMKGHMNLVNELGKKLLNNADSFYINLSEIELVSDSAEEQIQEEKEKAAYRCSSTPDKISQLDELEEEFHGQIYLFYKDARKVSSPIDQKVLDERYQKWDSYKESGLRDKTKSLLQRFCNPDELIRFEFPKEGEINLYNGKKLINHYPEICLRLLRDEPYKWTKENHILEALLDFNGSNNLLEITEKHGRNSRYRFSKDWDRYNLHMPYSGGRRIPMDQRSVKIGKMIQSLSREWHNIWDTEWPDWIAGQPNDWKPKCNGFICYDLTHWRTPIGKEGEIYFYLFKNIFASREIDPSDIDGNISSDNCKPWGINEKVEKLEELLNDILAGSIKFVRIDYGTNTP